MTTDRLTRMRARGAALLGAAMLASCASAPPAREPLEAPLARRIAATPGAHVSVVGQPLDADRPRLAWHADTVVHPASTMKLAVLVALAQAADAGRVRLDDSVLLANRFQSIADGSAYALDASDDSDGSVYARVGTRVPIRWLAERMITHSSNLATNALLTLVPPDSATAAARRLGAATLLVRRGVEDNAAFRRGLNNATAARDLAIVLRAIATDRAASPGACAWMRETLFAQAWNSAIPAGLPAGTRVAHKTGDITRVEHDAAIVYPAAGRPYVLVILTTGIADQQAARTLIADLARLVHAHLAAP